MTDALVLVAVLLAGLLAGNELGTLVALHPALRALPLDIQIEAERALTRRLGRIMPVAMITTLVTAGATVVAATGSPGSLPAVVAVVALALMLAITLLGNVPLNRRTERFSSDGPVEGWQAIRDRWERLHVDEVDDLVGLDGKADTHVKHLSGGQHRRLDLGLRLIGDPELHFLDEPTTGFDPSARRRAWELVASLRSLGRTIVLTTHDMGEAQAPTSRRSCSTR